MGGIGLLSYVEVGIQSAKILLVPQNFLIIMVLSNDAFFQYCDSNMGFFSIAPFCIAFKSLKK